MKLGETIWLCRRINDEENEDLILYDAPEKIRTAFNYLTVQPTRVALNNMAGFYTTEEQGEHLANGWNMVANYDIFIDKIQAGDLIYVDGVQPDEDSVNGQGANAIVTFVREQNRVIFYTLNRVDGV